MAEFLSMGGYAQFVWPSYGITAIVLVVNLWWVRHMRKSTLAQLKTNGDEPVESRRPTVRHVP